MANCIQCGRKLPALIFGKKICQWCVQHQAAQRGEENEIQRVETPPWLRRESSSMLVTQAIFGINVAVFVGMLFAGVSILENPSGQDLVRWGANFGPLTLSGQWWRLLTCVFIHGGFLHIAFNMWCLWSLGSIAEPLYGHETFLALYLITGVASSVASVAWNPGVLSVGASGALFGVAGALIASFYVGRLSLPHLNVQGTLVSLVIFAGYSLLGGAKSQAIDNAAHVGGLVSGLILGALITKIAPSRDDLFRRTGVLLAGLVLVAAGVGWLRQSRSYLVHAQNGWNSLAQFKPDEAIPELQKALRLRPDFAPARIDLARAYLFKRDYVHAEAEVRNVIAKNPHHEQAEQAYSVLGFVYFKENRLQDSQEAYASLLKINPNNAIGHSGRAAALAASNNYAEALQEYKLAANLDPGDETVYYDMGLVQFRMKLYDDAIESFLKQQQNDDDPDNENALAAAYEAKGMLHEAAEARKKTAGFQKEN